MSTRELRIKPYRAEDLELLGAGMPTGCVWR